MGVFLQRIKDKIKLNKSTLLFTIIMFILLSPLSFGLWIMISITHAENSLSVYLLGNLIFLVSQVFFPFIILIVSGHWISFALMSLKKNKYNMRLYLVLLLIQSLPLGFMFASLEANTSLEYKNERINEIKSKYRE